MQATGNHIFDVSCSTSYTKGVEGILPHCMSKSNLHAIAFLRSIILRFQANERTSSRLSRTGPEYVRGQHTCPKGPVKIVTSCLGQGSAGISNQNLYQSQCGSNPVCLSTNCWILRSLPSSSNYIALECQPNFHEQAESLSRPVWHCKMKTPQ